MTVTIARFVSLLFGGLFTGFLVTVLVIESTLRSADARYVFARAGPRLSTAASGAVRFFPFATIAASSIMSLQSW